MRERSEKQPPIAPRGSASITAQRTAKIAIVGSGPVGMLAALELARLTREVLLIAPDSKDDDRRTTALMMPAIELLEKIGIWDEQLQATAGRLATMRIIDATKRLIRAPLVNFQAQEIGKAAFGYNIPNKYLNRALNDKIAAESRISRHVDTVTDYHHHASGVRLTLGNGVCHDVALVVAADGRLSKARLAAGIKTKMWNYPQSALVLNFSHELPHDNIASEFHTEQGPFTQVPLPGKRSSLVWVLRPQAAQRLLGLGASALAAEIEEHMQSMLGKITVETQAGNWPPQSWPMSGAVPLCFAARRTILIGEAAHVFPPIGAQGLNLGVRDVIALGKAILDDKENPGSEALMRAYNYQRRGDVWLRTGLVHALNRALLSDFLPIQLLRGAGLESLRQFAPLRALMMREGLLPGSGWRALAPWQAC